MKKWTVALAMILLLCVLASCSSSNWKVLNAKNFISKAESAKYTIIIEEDYDDFGTYWAGAHKFAAGVEKIEGKEIYVIDYTRDVSVYNAEIEYLDYVDEVKQIGGNSNSGSGKNYEFQINSSATKFGIALRVEDVNLFVVAGAEYKDEILKFFKNVGYELKV